MCKWIKKDNIDGFIIRCRWNGGAFLVFDLFRENKTINQMKIKNLFCANKWYRFSKFDCIEVYCIP